MADYNSSFTGAEIDAAITLANSAQQPPSEGAFVNGDKTKLDGIEALADVTDATNVEAAGALMDSEVTNLAAVKSFDPTDYATAAQGALADTAIQPEDLGTSATLDVGTTAGTVAAGDDARFVVQDIYVIACSDETTDLETGTANVTFRMPTAGTLTDVKATVTTAPVGSNLIVDINETGTTVLSTKISIDDGEKTSETAATPPVINDSSLADDSEITIDIDQVGSGTAGAGLKVYLYVNRG